MMAEVSMPEPMGLPNSPSVPTIAELRQGEAPFVLADALGLVIEVNEPFTHAYGWTEDDLRGQSLSLILPEAFQMAHHLGFSRFQSTGQSEILAHPLRLRTICRDGQEVVSEHFIVAERSGEGWVFAATLTPLPDGSPTDA
jgi:PAS domain S-box-containing protein